MEIDISFEKQFEGLPETQVVELCERVLEKTARAAGEDPDLLEVSVLFTGDEHIHELNRQYRGVDRATDVLSFALREAGPAEMVEGQELLGDIVVSVDTASRQAREYGETLAAEVARLLCHGMLHLLGYDHCTEDEEAQMMALQESILSDEPL
ncbi:MAG TPA: rRNA maturation RNase YbeY [Firmicutes bacterium]|nr:rRNA maturation RNase YbeY [Bacillota bacterium]